VLRVTKDAKVLMVFRVLLVLRVLSEHKEMMVPKEHKVVRVR
jgi:hypothetical protein